MTEGVATQANYSALIINSHDCDDISAKLPLTIVNSGSAAKTALMDSKRRFAGIFIDPIMAHPGGVDLIATAHRYRPVTPVYILYRQNKPFSEAELDRMGVHGQLQTPITASIIQKRIAAQIFDYWFDVPAFPKITAPSTSLDVRRFLISTFAYLPDVTSKFSMLATLFHRNAP